MSDYNEFSQDTYLQFLAEEQSRKERFDMFSMKQEMVKQASQLNKLKEEINYLVSTTEKAKYESSIAMLKATVKRLSKDLEAVAQERDLLKEKLIDIQDILGSEFNSDDEDSIDDEDDD